MPDAATHTESIRSDRSPNQPADDVLSDIHVLANLIGQGFSGFLEGEYGLTVAEWRVMLTLGRYPGQTAAEITVRWAMDKMAISRALQRLEEEGLIARARNPEDRRSYRLFLSGKGKEAFEKIIPDANERYRALVGCLSREEQAVVRGAFEKLTAQVDRLQG